MIPSWIFALVATVVCMGVVGVIFWCLTYGSLNRIGRVLLIRVLLILGSVGMGYFGALTIRLMF